MRAYSERVGKHGRLADHRWIEGERVGAEPMLDAPEIGPVADANAMYEAVTTMRRVPITKASVIKIIVPLALLPLLIAALQIPRKDLPLRLAKVLVWTRFATGAAKLRCQRRHV